MRQKCPKVSESVQHKCTMVVLSKSTKCLELSSGVRENAVESEVRVSGGCVRKYEVFETFKWCPGVCG